MNVTAEYPDDDSIDVKQLLVRLWRGRLWIAGSIVVSAVAFALVAFLATPIYRASTVLVSASSERSGLSGTLGSALGSLGGLASLAGLNLGDSGTETEEALAVLRSREFTEKFIADRQLMPLLYAKRWDAGSKSWWSNVKRPTSAQAYKYFNSKIRSISKDTKTGLVTLNVDWRDREQATAWANDLVQRLNAEMRARAIAKASASVRYLEQELDIASVVATREALSRLIESQVQQRMLANVSQEYAFRVVDRAMAPDSNDPLRPRKAMLLIAGPLVGLIIGIVVVLTLGAVSRGSVRSSDQDQP